MEACQLRFRISHNCNLTGYCCQLIAGEPVKDSLIVCLDRQNSVLADIRNQSVYIQGSTYVKLKGFFVCTIWSFKIATQI